MLADRIAIGTGIHALSVVSTENLLPASWAPLASRHQCYFFNPSIADLDGRIIMAYRVVLPDQLRRIAICELDDAFQVIPMSAVPLSDHLEKAGNWHADPRFCRLNGQLLLHFNNGAKIPNEIFMVELDQKSLLPITPCRKVILDHPRQSVEKNWMFFENGGMLFTVYSISPHRVHRVHLESSGDIRCVATYEVPWDVAAYASKFGVPRGSTPPVRVGNAYYSFFHSQYSKSLGRRLLNNIKFGTAINGKSYSVGFYSFCMTDPFKPESVVQDQLFPLPLRPVVSRPRLSNSYDTCFYPSGAIFRDGEWTISMGLHDDGCGLLRLDHQTLLNACHPASFL